MITFFFNKSDYLNNNAYLNVWCHSCLAKHVQANYETNQTNIVNGIIIHS